jgi:hypothetical protein
MLVGLILSARLDWHNAPARRNWVIALWLYLAVSLITIFFHMPLNVRLAAAIGSPVGMRWISTSHRAGRSGDRGERVHDPRDLATGPYPPRPAHACHPRLRPARACRWPHTLNAETAPMTDDTYRKTVNIIAIVASAAFAGGGLLILVSYGIRWLGTDPLVWRAGFWDEFLNFASRSSRST